MFNLVINENDEKWLRGRYPELTINRVDNILVVSRKFHFDAIYQDTRITDTYEIRIELQNSDLSDLPKVAETAYRIKKVSEKRKIPLADLHAYGDGTACLCVRFAESSYFPSDFSFQMFMEELVVPYFYAQSYFEKFDNWPWETYSHGVLGWLEWYCDQKENLPQITCELIIKLKSPQGWKNILSELMDGSEIKGHHSCICGSTKKFRNCHNKVFRGLWKLKKDVEEFGVSL